MNFWVGTDVTKHTDAQNGLHTVQTKRSRQKVPGIGCLAKSGRETEECMKSVPVPCAVSCSPEMLKATSPEMAHGWLLI